MKEPREVLLDRHRHVEPQLDRIRCAALEQVREPAPLQPRRPAHFPENLRVTEWLRSWRRHLIGLGLAWALIALLNVIDTPTALPSRTPSHRFSLREVWLALREHQRQLLEWTDLQEPKPIRAPHTGVPPRQDKNGAASVVT